MATRGHDPEKEERVAAERPSWLFSKAGREQLVEAEQRQDRRQEKLWADIKRAEAQVFGIETPRERRALDRMYADFVAGNALSLVGSADTMRAFYLETHRGKRICLIEEHLQQGKAFHEAKSRSLSLWLRAPLGDVGLFRRFEKVLGYMIYLPMFVLGKMCTDALRYDRAKYKRDVEKATREKVKSNSKDAGTK